jgi:5-aminopentanamidase
LQAAPGDVRANVRKAVGTVEDVDANLYIFPELFLTGYIGGGCRDLGEDVLSGISELSSLTDNRCAIAVGAPSFDRGLLFNSMYFMSGRTVRYDKLNLPSFGVFHEKETFTPGESPAMADFMGMRFGLTICYDLFFPELYRFYCRNGADANICISASPESSRPFFEKVLPARSVENTAYTLFVNNIGTAQGLPMAGRSRSVSPVGEAGPSAGIGEEVLLTVLSKEDVTAAKDRRPTVSDIRDDIIWS